MFLEKIGPNMRDVGLIDHSLNTMFSKTLPWSSIMNYLLQTHCKHARRLKENENQITDLILFNQLNTDYLLYLKLTKKEGSDTFQMFSVGRAGVRDAIEYEHINNTINSILYFLWCK
jgi:AraC-like DNA-binding protein